MITTKQTGKPSERTEFQRYLTITIAKRLSKTERDFKRFLAAYRTLIDSSAADNRGVISLNVILDVSRR